MAIEPGAGGQGGSPSLVSLLFMYLNGGMNPWDAMVLSVQYFAQQLYSTIGDSGVD